ncbi:uncharacterized protein LOC103510641 [Diaphorina citri]|uniref:Uncharacterized protein LOC103510641 n=1 Tax=Diaphorina citri TaxID=121845 RepID=A0A3Q0J0H6_DIACI|nr:uncharacterized protein LOC103510641 [Diaphorina citri]
MNKRKCSCSSCVVNPRAKSARIVERPQCTQPHSTTTHRSVAPRTSHWECGQSNAPHGREAKDEKSRVENEVWREIPSRNTKVNEPTRPGPKPTLTARCQCGQSHTSPDGQFGKNDVERKIPIRNEAIRREPKPTRNEFHPIPLEGRENAQCSARIPISLPFTKCPSTSSSSAQIDSAFACACSECAAYNRKKAGRRRSFSRASHGFHVDKLTRQQSRSGMGDGDADKLYITDRYRLYYDNLKLLDVSYFAPKFGFLSSKFGGEVKGSCSGTNN